MNGDIDAVASTEVRRFVETIHFQQIASRDVGFGGEGIVLFDDVHAMRTHINLVADLVSALISAVEREIHKLMRWIELESEPFAHFAGDGIANHRLVGSVGKECPVLGVGISLAQEFLFLMKLDAIGFLRHVPSGIATSTNLQGIVLQDVVVLIHIVHRGIHVFRLAPDSHVAKRVHVDVWQVGQSCMTLRQDRVRKTKKPRKKNE